MDFCDLNSNKAVAYMCVYMYSRDNVHDKYMQRSNIWNVNGGTFLSNKTILEISTPLTFHLPGEALGLD